MLESPGYSEVPKRENLSMRATSREVDLAWLAGIVDGEGNLQATVQEKPCGTGRATYFEPKLRITNTDVRMIKKVSAIYVSEGFVFFYALNRVSRYKNKRDTWRDQLEITISSKGSIAKALRAVIPYLVAKQRYAELMLSAVEWVQARPRRGNGSTGVNYTTDPDFHKMIAAMQKERASLIDPSTTARRAGEVLSW